MARLLINVSACISFSALTLVVWWQEGHVPRKIPHFSELFSSRTSRGGPDRNSLTLVHPEKWQLNSSGNRMKFINTHHLLSLLITQVLELLMYCIHQRSCIWNLLFIVHCFAARGRPKKTCREIVEKDCLAH